MPGRPFDQCLELDSEIWVSRTVYDPTVCPLIRFKYVCRIVTEECYPWDGRMTSCIVSNSRSFSELTLSCPAESGRRVRTSPLRRVGLMYRVATEQGIMYEIMNWGSVQGVYCNLSIYHKSLSVLAK